MKLADWLKAHSETQAKFAARINTSQSHVAGLCAGDRLPSFRLARNIVFVTQGAVGFEDLFDTGEPPEAAQ